MATKEVMVTAPLMVLSWDWTFGSPGLGARELGSGSRAQSLETRRPSRWSLYVGLAATWLIVTVLAAGRPRAHSVGFAFPGWPWWTYLITQAGVVAHYLRLAIVPSPLVLDYEWPAAHSLAGVAPQATMVLALIGATMWALMRRMPVGFAGAWLFGILAPTSSVIPVVTEVAAEHRMYLPLAAVVATLVVGAYRVWPRRLPRLVLLVAATGVVAVFAVLTDARNRDYADYERIWLDTIHKRPSNARARNNYASALLVQGRNGEAEDHLRAAVQARPDFAEAQANLGVVLCARGAFDEGIAHLQRAIAARPDDWQAYEGLGEAYAAQGQFAPALGNYTKALEGRIDDVMLLNRIAWILATASDAGLRDGARARTLAERAARLTNREDAVTLDSLAAAYAELGRFEDAATTAREALALARTKGDPAIAPELESRLALYQAHRPFREAAARQR
jgi:tetratricopeptide (TPR) repeat protein